MSHFPAGPVDSANVIQFKNVCCDRAAQAFEHGAAGDSAATSSVRAATKRIGSTISRCSWHQGQPRRSELARIGRCRSCAASRRRWSSARGLAAAIQAHGFASSLLPPVGGLQARATSAACKCSAMCRFLSPADSADVWANPQLFLLEPIAGRVSSPACRPIISARPGNSGATRFTTGRRWRATATPGGSRGCGRTLRQVDLVRLDHFRGFAAAWHIPPARRRRSTGEWEPGPGGRLVRCGPARRSAGCRSSPRISA